MCKQLYYGTFTLLVYCPFLRMAWLMIDGKDRLIQQHTQYVTS